MKKKTESSIKAQQVKRKAEIDKVCLSNALAYAYDYVSAIYTDIIKSGYQVNSFHFTILEALHELLKITRLKHLELSQLNEMIDTKSNITIESILLENAQENYLIAGMDGSKKIDSKLAASSILAWILYHAIKLKKDSFIDIWNWINREYMPHLAGYNLVMHAHTICTYLYLSSIKMIKNYSGYKAEKVIPSKDEFAKTLGFEKISIYENLELQKLSNRVNERK